MKTTLSLSLFFAPCFLFAQNYIQQGEIQLTNVFVANTDNVAVNYPNNNPQAQVKIGNPFGNKANGAQQASQPKPKVNKPKPVKVKQKVEPMVQMQYKNPGFNPGVIQSVAMAKPMQMQGHFEASSPGRAERTAQVKELGIPLKYRLKYKRIRIGEKKAFRSGRSAFKAPKRKGTKEKCFLASL